MKSISTRSAFIVLCWLAVMPSEACAKQQQATPVLLPPLQDIDYKLGHNQLGAKDVDRLTAFMKLHPQDAQAHYLAGKIYEHDGLGELADEEFKTADHLAPDKPEAMLESFVGKVEGNDIPAAMQDFGYLSGRFPRDPSVLLMWAMISTGKGQPQIAEAFIEKALAAVPSRVGVAAAGGAVRLNQGRPKEALELAKRDLKSAPDNYLANAVAGEACMHMQAYEDGARYLRKAFELRPLEKSNAHIFADSFCQGRMYGDALAPAMIYMAMCTQSDDLKTAKKELQTILRHVSTTASDNVAQTVDGLLIKSPFRSRLHLALGDVYDHLGWFKQAERHYIKGTELEPGAARGFYRLGLDKQHDGEHVAAMLMFKMAYDRDSKDPDIQLAYQRAIVRYQLAYSRAAERQMNSSNDIALRLKHSLDAWARHI